MATHTLSRACIYVHWHCTCLSGFFRGLIPDPLTSSGGEEWGWEVEWRLFNVCGINTVQGEFEQERMWSCVCICEFREAAWGGSGNHSLSRTWLHRGGVSMLEQLCMIPNGIVGSGHNFKRCLLYANIIQGNLNWMPLTKPRVTVPLLFHSFSLLLPPLPTFCVCHYMWLKGHHQSAELLCLVGPPCEVVQVGQ